jgi:hypothetical protein
MTRESVYFTAHVMQPQPVGMGYIFGIRRHFEVVDTVVERVAVDVVDAFVRRNIALEELPNKTMRHYFDLDITAPPPYVHISRRVQRLSSNRHDWLNGYPTAVTVLNALGMGPDGAVWIDTQQTGVNILNYFALVAFGYSRHADTPISDWRPTTGSVFRSSMRSMVMGGTRWALLAVAAPAERRRGERVDGVGEVGLEHGDLRPSVGQAGEGAQVRRAEAGGRAPHRGLRIAALMESRNPSTRAA